jgi:glutamine phosphoribosylpyrophosphate amidotransferase
MDIEKIKSIPEKYRRSVHLTLRVSPDIKNWLVENNFSATSIFHEAIKELGYEKGSASNFEEDVVEPNPESSRERPLQDNGNGEVYYVKQRVRTRYGWRTKLVHQNRPKKYGRGKGNIAAQRGRARGRRRRG